MNKHNVPDDDDLPPDLEDIPEEVLKQQPNKKAVGKGGVDLGDYAQPKPEVQKVVPVEPPKEEKKQEVFGGMKKGFFSSQPKPKAATEQKKTEKSDIIEIKPTQKKDPRVLEEVQEAMKVNQTLLEKKNEWMNPDLLNKIAANPKLAKLFTNPEYMAAITLMQTKPQEAMRKYGNNPEFQELLLEFSKIMGSHFETMAQKTTTEEQQQNNAPALPRDPKAEEYLMDPKVRSVVQYLQQNPKIDFNMLLRSDPELAIKFKYLIEKGYFQIHSG